MTVFMQLELVLKYSKTALKTIKYSQGLGCIITNSTGRRPGGGLV